jgi:hypothetical protein
MVSKLVLGLADLRLVITYNYKIIHIDEVIHVYMTSLTLFWTEEGLLSNVLPLLQDFEGTDLIWQSS